jgi:hypothetical protein
MDWFTRWPIVIPVPSQDANVLADAIMREVVSVHGVPEVLVSDQGRSLTGRVMQRLCKRLGIERRATSAYCPSSNGRMERYHGFLDRSLTPFAERFPFQWDEFLHLVTFPYRVTPVAGMSYSPFELLYGRKPKLPVHILTGSEKKELQLDAEEYGLHITKHLAEQHARFIKEDDAYRAKFREFRDKGRKQIVFAPGEEVLLWKPPTASAFDRSVDILRPGDPTQFVPQPPFSKKVRYTWTGPHVVTRQLGVVNYEIRLGDNGKLYKTHVNRLRGYQPFEGKILAPPRPVPRPRNNQFLTDPELVKPGSLCIFRSPYTGLDDDEQPFWVGKTLTVTGHVLKVQWLGNLHGVVQGTYRPGWLRRRDGEPYYAAKARGGDLPYTNEDSKVKLTKAHVVAHAFQLTQGARLSAAILNHLSTSEQVLWSRFDTPARARHEAPESKED